MQPICIGNHMSSSAIWKKFERVGFQKVQNSTSPTGRVLFELFENPWVQIFSKLHEEIIGFPFNNIHEKISRYLVMKIIHLSVCFAKCLAPWIIIFRFNGIFILTSACFLNGQPKSSASHWGFAFRAGLKLRKYTQDALRRRHFKLSLLETLCTRHQREHVATIWLAYSKSHCFLANHYRETTALISFFLHCVSFFLHCVSLKQHCS